MYFFNIKKLKKDIIEENLTEIERCKYLFMSALFFSSIIFIPTNKIDRNYTDVITEIFFFILEIFLLMMSYKLFKKYKSKDFLGKFLSLNFVLGIRFLFFCLLFYAFFYCIFNVLLSIFYKIELKYVLLLTEVNPVDKIFFIVSFSFFSLIYYYRLYVHLKEVVVLENNNISSLNLSTEPS